MSDVKTKQTSLWRFWFWSDDWTEPQDLINERICKLGLFLVAIVSWIIFALFIYFHLREWKIDAQGVISAFLTVNWYFTALGCNYRKLDKKTETFRASQPAEKK